MMNCRMPVLYGQPSSISPLQLLSTPSQQSSFFDSFTHVGFGFSPPADTQLPQVISPLAPTVPTGVVAVADTATVFDGGGAVVVAGGGAAVVAAAVVAGGGGLLFGGGAVWMVQPARSAIAAQLTNERSFMTISWIGF
jgi:hypothetical protein